MKKYLLIILCSWGLVAQAQNNPYVDDKLVHFGFSLGVNLMSFHIPNDDPARVSNLLPGFNVGFVSDVRLSRHLNLRFCPGLSFSQRTIQYKETYYSLIGDQVVLLSIPISIPLYLKWSAERENNYRPYLIGGGGMEYNVYRDAEQPVLLKGLDYFVEVGFGCDFYFQWFKCCPQITYRIGFANVLTPVEENIYITEEQAPYTNVLTKLTSQALYITFNFE